MQRLPPFVVQLSLIRWQLWRRLFSRLNPVHGRLFLLAALGGFQSLLVLPTLYLVRFCFNTAIPQHRAGALVLTGALILLIRILTSTLFLLARQKSTSLAKMSVARLRRDLVERLYRAPYDYLVRNDAAHIQGRIVHETERLDNLLSTLLGAVLPALLTMTVLVTLLLWINWQLLILSGFLAPVAWVLGVIGGHRVKPAVSAFKDSFERFNKGMYFVVRQMALTRSRGFEAGEINTQAGRIADLERSGVRMAMSFAVHGQIQMLAIGAIGLLVLIIGGLEVIIGRLSLGDLIAFYLGASFLNNAMSQLTSVLPDLVTCDETLARLDALMADDADDSYIGQEALRFTGVIAMRDVAFRHSRAPVLDGISLDLAPGCNVTIIGPNGSGKTTIVGLILGFYRPYRGGILANGVPYERLDLGELRRAIGFVPQHPTFFTGTVAENLGYGRPQCGLADIVAAAERAGVAQFIRALPETYDTQIGEGGVLLSGGEAQRLAIARALVGDPRLLIFDEPTNHLDAATVASIMGKLLSAREDIGLLVISHDPAVVALADTVFRLEAGTLIQEPQRTQTITLSRVAL